MRSSASASAVSSMAISANCSSTRMLNLMKKNRTIATRLPPSPSPSSSSSYSINVVRCEVANVVEESTSSGSARIGARVKVKVPLKVYHVPKVAEVDLTGMEGEIKQYVALWNGKRISANLPFKVQFVADIEGRGPVKFFAHLKEDEFDYV